MKLTYGDFYKTGLQDCANAIDFTDFDMQALARGKSPADVVNETWTEWDEDGMFERWAEQQDFEDLDPRRAYEEWRDGWKACAVDLLAKQKTKLQDNPGRPRPTTQDVMRAFERSPAIRGGIGNRAMMAIRSGELSDMDSGRFRVTFFGLDGPHGHVTRDTDKAIAEETRAHLDAPIVPMSDSDVIAWTSTEEFVKGSKITAFTQAENTLSWRAGAKGRGDWARQRITAANDLGSKHGAVNVRGKPYDPGALDAGTADLEQALRELEHPKENPMSCTPCKNPAPRRWWEGPAPARAVVCYPTKTSALRMFIDTNSSIIQNYGGVDYQVSPSEFDAVNHKYGLIGKKAARTIAEAVWAAMPTGKPYCLDRLDLDALNDTSPAREAGELFRLPDIVYERTLAAKEDDELLPGWVTEFEPIMPARSGHTVPPGGFEPYRVRLVEQEPGVAHFTFNPARRGPFLVSTSAFGKHILTFQRSDLRTAMHDTVKELLGTGGNEAEIWDADQNLVAFGMLLRRKMRGGDMKYSVRFVPGPGPQEADGDETTEPVENPPWVTTVIAKHFATLEESVPPQWLPKLSKPRAVAGRLTASMKELGCGSYGCVLPTLDPAVVLKLTTDETEAQFANELSSTLIAPIVVRYRLVRGLPELHKGRPAFLLWRDSADRVGEIVDVIKEGGGDHRAADRAIADQHKAAQAAFLALHRGEPADRLLTKWERSVMAMGKVRELRELAAGLRRVLHENRVFLGDVHAGNLGLVAGKWVVIDPGHVAVIE